MATVGIEFTSNVAPGDAGWCGCATVWSASPISQAFGVFSAGHTLQNRGQNRVGLNQSSDQYLADGFSYPFTSSVTRSFAFTKIGVRVSLTDCACWRPLEKIKLLSFLCRERSPLNSRKQFYCLIDHPRLGGRSVALSVADDGMRAESSLEVIAGSTTGLIKLRAGNTYVEKAPYPDSRDAHLSARDLRREFVAYQQLPKHVRLLCLHSDSTPESLVLPYLRNGCLHNFLRAAPVSSVRQLQFAADVAEGLHLLHCVGVVHGDINPWNFLIDDDIRICIIDFAGSTINGEAGSAFEGVRYCLPRSIDAPSTIRSDLFALGSLLYEIVTSEEPYHECKDEEVEELFKNGQFPSTQDLQFGRVILGCWLGRYDSAESVYKDIKETASDGQC